MTTPPDEAAEAFEVIETIVIPPGKYEINGRLVDLKHTVKVKTSAALSRAIAIIKEVGGV